MPLLFYTYIRATMFFKDRSVAMKDKDLLKLFLRNGWQEVGVRGSHHKVRKGDRTEIIPIHGTDVAPGLLNAILKRNNLK